MCKSSLTVQLTLSLGQLHAGFLALLPRIQLHGQIYFRHLKCPDQKADAIQEMVGLAWRWFLRLAKRGKDACQFASALAAYAARAVRNGRRVCGQERTQEVLSPRAQQRHHFTTNSLPNISTLNGNVFDEALADNTQTPVLDQVVFRCDFPAWLKTRTDRDRRVVQDLMVGERTLDVSDKYGISPSRVSQLRNEFHQDWERYCADSAEASQVATP
jgi:hypothetical protein